MFWSTRRTILRRLDCLTRGSRSLLIRPLSMVPVSIASARQIPLWFLPLRICTCLKSVISSYLKRESGNVRTGPPIKTFGGDDLDQFDLFDTPGLLRVISLYLTRFSRDIFTVV